MHSPARKFPMAGPPPGQDLRCIACRIASPPPRSPGLAVAPVSQVAHLRPRSKIIGAVARIRSALAFATHQFFRNAGFVYASPPGADACMRANGDASSSSGDVGAFLSGQREENDEPLVREQVAHSAQLRCQLCTLLRWRWRLAREHYGPCGTLGMCTRRSSRQPTARALARCSRYGFRQMLWVLCAAVLWILRACCG